MTADPFIVARLGLRNDWLAQVVEPILDPGREIVDPHHHFWNHGGNAYELDQLWADTGSGHNVRQTVFIECHSKYDRDAPETLQSLGETRYVAGLAATARAHPERAQVAGIVAFADLRNPDLDAVLDAHQAASDGLLCGIRQAGAYPIDPALMIPGRGAPGLYGDPAFRRGVARLGARGLAFDTWMHHPLLPDYIDLARAVPDTTLVLNHFGTPLGVGAYAGKRDAIFAVWRDQMTELAGCANVVAKLGGLAMPDNGYDWHNRDRPLSSDEFVATYGDWFHHAIACFGPDRCMFESNFPVDRISISYPVVWNAFKKLAARYDMAGQDAMFAGTARRVYHLG